jgi:hypothetical protein
MRAMAFAGLLWEYYPRKLRRNERIDRHCASCGNDVGIVLHPVTDEPLLFGPDAVQRTWVRPVCHRGCLVANEHQALCQRCAKGIQLLPPESFSEAASSKMRVNGCWVKVGGCER